MTDLDEIDLWVEIQQLRENLHDIANKKGIKSSDTIRASQRLDNKLNEYHYMSN